MTSTSRSASATCWRSGLPAPGRRAARRAAHRRRVVARDLAVRRHLDDGDGDHRRGCCLRRDPGNALLREMSDLGTQFRVLQCLDGTAVPAPRPYFYEPDPSVLGAPFLVMEKVPGVCPSPWGRDGLRFYAEAAERGVLPDSFTDALVAIHTLDWRAAGLDFLGVPEPGDDFARREIATWRALDRRIGRRGRPGAHRRHLLARGQHPGRSSASPSSTAPTAPATC